MVASGRGWGTVDSPRWTVNGGRWKVDGPRWTVNGRRWNVDSRRWTAGRRLVFSGPPPATVQSRYSSRIGGGVSSHAGPLSGRGRSCSQSAPVTDSTAVTRQWVNGTHTARGASPNIARIHADTNAAGHGARQKQAALQRQSSLSIFVF